MNQQRQPAPETAAEQVYLVAPWHRTGPSLCVSDSILVTDTQGTAETGAGKGEFCWVSHAPPRTKLVDLSAEGLGLLVRHGASCLCLALFSLGTRHRDPSPDSWQSIDKTVGGRRTERQLCFHCFVMCVFLVFYFWPLLLVGTSTTLIT